MSGEDPGTLLTISGPSGTGELVALYSARGLTQTLTPIAAAIVLRRSINGKMIDMSAPQFRQYASKITCTDQRAPALDGIWPGMEVTVDCVVEIAGSGSAGRSGNDMRTEGDVTYYRPTLTMIVTALNWQIDEYGCAVGWELDLEEKEAPSGS